MSRPTRRVITSGVAAWDADVDENFNKVFNAPFPMYQVDDVGDLPSAGSYESCFALVEDTLYISNGSSWEPDENVAANVLDSTATTAPEMVSDFNGLLSALQLAGIMESA